MALLISCVFGICHEAQVNPSVISPVTVYVVNLSFWYLASHYRPCGAVRSNFVVEKTAMPVARVNARAGFFSRILCVPSGVN